MREISKSVKRADHDEKITGRAKYTGDYQTGIYGDPILNSHFVRSQNAHARILKMEVPEMPSGYYFISAKDAPKNISYYPANDLPRSIQGEERDRLLKRTPLFADKEVEYYGQPLAMVVGPDDAVVRRLARQVKVEYEPLPAVTSLKASDECFFELERSLGDYRKAFDEADEVYEEEFDTGVQYQSPIEPQSLIAELQKDGRVYVHGAMQCPFVVRTSVALSLDIPEEKVHVAQEATGGAFGGKEDFPSLTAPQAAVAAVVTGKPVRIIFDRGEDIQFAAKRHPSHTKVRIALRNKEITAMEVFGKMDAGAYVTASPDVGTVYHCKIPCCYTIENLHVRTQVMKTNLPPNGAFRGFGNPQAVFAMEMVMSHLASHLGVDEIAFKQKYFAKQGGMTSTGGCYHFPVPLPQMLARAAEATDYYAKREKYAKTQSGRKRYGIGIAFANQGSTIGGAAEWAVIKPTVRIIKDAQGNISVKTAQADMGQGPRTTFAKIAAAELGIPPERVSVGYPDTDETHDTGPTAASRSIMIVGEAVRLAAKKLRENWIDGQAQEFEGVFPKPDFIGSYDDQTATGDCFQDYLWNITVLEIMVDVITGMKKILNVYGIYNVGTLIDRNIVTGQMEGGLAQGVGYAAYERLVYGENGKIFNTAFSDYHIPTFTDLENLRVEFDETEYPYGPYGAKGAGELPVAGIGAAYLNALEQALGGTENVKLHRIPFLEEDIVDVLWDGSDQNGMFSNWQEPEADKA